MYHRSKFTQKITGYELNFSIHNELVCFVLADERWVLRKPTKNTQKNRYKLKKKITWVPKSFKKNYNKNISELDTTCQQGILKTQAEELVNLLAFFDSLWKEEEKEDDENNDDNSIQKHNQTQSNSKTELVNVILLKLQTVTDTKKTSHAHTSSNSDVFFNFFGYLFAFGLGGSFNEGSMTKVPAMDLLLGGPPLKSPDLKLLERVRDCLLLINQLIESKWINFSINLFTKKIIITTATTTTTTTTSIRWTQMKMSTQNEKFLNGDRWMVRNKNNRSES